MNTTFFGSPERTFRIEITSATDSPEDHSDGNRDEKKGTKSNTKPNQNSRVCKKERPKSKSRSNSWSSLSPESESETGSPPRRSIGCLWCSPKKEKSVPRKQGKENRLFSSSSSPSWGNDAEYDGDSLGSCYFSF
ncbi:hypothetical protein LXL04_038322 [Taraxacum kok-saghyz]